MACPGSFLSCGENHPDPKSGRDLDLDKLICTMYCQGDESKATFLSASGKSPKPACQSMSAIVTPLPLCLLGYDLAMSMDL